MNENYGKSNGLRLNYSIITEIVDEGEKVLDLGCGDGTLLAKLVDEKKVKGIGIEINQDSVVSSIEKGLSVIQSDIDEGLNFQDNEFDWVILNQTLQSTEKPDFVINEMLRVGKKVIVSFPNFAYWRIRLYLFLTGHMPKSKILPFEWYDTPNIHLLTVNDFYKFCRDKNIKILQSIFMTRANIRKGPVIKFLSNLFSEEVIFVITRTD